LGGCGWFRLGLRCLVGVVVELMMGVVAVWGGLDCPWFWMGEFHTVMLGEHARKGRVNVIRVYRYCEALVQRGGGHSERRAG
jgi:hypothetical protein